MVYSDKSGTMPVPGPRKIGSDDAPVPVCILLALDCPFPDTRTGRVQVV